MNCEKTYVSLKLAHIGGFPPDTFALGCAPPHNEHGVGGGVVVVVVVGGGAVVVVLEVVVVVVVVGGGVVVVVGGGVVVVVGGGVVVVVVDMGTHFGVHQGFGTGGTGSPITQPFSNSMTHSRSVQDNCPVQLRLLEHPVSTPPGGGFPVTPW